MLISEFYQKIKRKKKGKKSLGPLEELGMRQRRVEPMLRSDSVFTSGALQVFPLSHQLTIQFIFFILIAPVELN